MYCFVGPLPAIGRQTPCVKMLKQFLRALYLILYSEGRVSSKQTKINFGSNRNKPKQDLFRVCFGLFRETKTFLFRFVSVFRTCIETTETNRTVSKRTETILNFLKNTWIFSLLQFTITIQSNQKDIIKFCWSLYCYFYNCTVQYINVNIFRNLSLN